LLLHLWLNMFLKISGVITRLPRRNAFPSMKISLFPVNWFFEKIDISFGSFAIFFYMSQGYLERSSIYSQHVYIL